MDRSDLAAATRLGAENIAVERKEGYAPDGVGAGPGVVSRVRQRKLMGSTNRYVGDPCRRSDAPLGVYPCDRHRSISLSDPPLGEPAADIGAMPASTVRNELVEDLASASRIPHLPGGNVLRSRCFVFKVDTKPRKGLYSFNKRQLAKPPPLTGKRRTVGVTEHTGEPFVHAC